VRKGVLFLERPLGQRAGRAGQGRARKEFTLSLRALAMRFRTWSSESSSESSPVVAAGEELAGIGGGVNSSSRLSTAG
jgi:hypothetical protein